MNIKDNSLKPKIIKTINRKYYKENKEKKKIDKESKKIINR